MWPLHERSDPNETKQHAMKFHARLERDEVLNGIPPIVWRRRISHGNALKEGTDARGKSLNRLDLHIFPVAAATR
jgi:hypothetical protein